MFSGDDFVKYTGDAPKMTELQSFAWNAFERGSGIHAVANPSQAEKLFHVYQETREVKKKELSSALVDRYGDQTSFVAQDEALKPSQTDTYVEYTKDGSIKKLDKGKNEPIIQPKYINNHPSYWGSWHNSDGLPGFACCHNTVRNSYCTGAAGIEAEEDRLRRLSELEKAGSGEDEEDAEEAVSTSKASTSDAKRPHPDHEEPSEAKRPKPDRDESAMFSEDELKRMRQMGISAEEMAEHQRNRGRSEDPLYNEMLKKRNGDFV